MTCQFFYEKICETKYKKCFIFKNRCVIIYLSRRGDTMASNIVQLLDEKIKIENWLNSVLYGSIETRVRKSKKYIYIHYRKGNKIITKYAGEYSARLVNVIYENTLLAKELKKRHKKILKQLKDLDYVEKELSSNVKSCIKHLKSNLSNIIVNQLGFDGIYIESSSVFSLLDDGIIHNLSIEHANKVNNLKSAWEFILNKDVLNVGLSYSLLSQINGLIDSGFSYNAGKLRRIPLQIDKTSYIPTIPFEEQINDTFNMILKTKAKPLEKALDIFIYLLKSFVFTNSNLSTSLIFVNYYMIKSGLGYFDISLGLKEEFNELLTDLYEWNDKDKLKSFLIEKCYFN